MITVRVRLHREYNRWYRCFLRLCWNIQGKDAPCVYMFHSVVNTLEQVYSQFAITKDSFEHFIVHLVTQGQKAMDMNILCNAINSPSQYLNHYCITFDDIYDTVYTNAYPILKKYNIPFVIFITDELVGKVDPWSKMPMITDEHLREMLADPLCILASHGTKHKMFRDYTHTEAVTALTMLFDA